MQHPPLTLLTIKVVQIIMKLPTVILMSELKVSLKQMLGRGKKYFNHQDRNLIAEFKDAGFQYIDDLSQLDSLNKQQAVFRCPDSLNDIFTLAVINFLSQLWGLDLAQYPLYFHPTFLSIYSSTA